MFSPLSAAPAIRFRFPAAADGRSPAAASSSNRRTPTRKRTGFRIPRPLRSGDGAWVADGWTAWERLPGEHRQDRWAETIAVCRAYHHALRHLHRPAFFDARDDVFSRADRIAWNEAPIDCRPPVRETLERLDALRRPLDLPCQVIHGDVTENSGYCPDRWLAVRASSSPDINTSIPRRIVSARKSGGRRAIPLAHPAIARVYLRWCSAGIVL